MPPAIPSDCIEIVRCALAPRMVLKGHDPKIISPAQAVAKWPRFDFGDGIPVPTLSTGRGDKLTTIASVHNFGCRVARAANTARARGRTKPLRRPQETAHYIGAFRMSVPEVLSIDTDFFEVCIVDTPNLEDNLPEHCDIVLRFKRAPADEHEIDAGLTEVIAELVLCLRDPQSFTCDEDDDVAGFLSEIRLIETPVFRAAG